MTTTNDARLGAEPREAEINFCMPLKIVRGEARIEDGMLHVCGAEETHDILGADLGGRDPADRRWLSIGDVSYSLQGVTKINWQ